MSSAPHIDSLLSGGGRYDIEILPKLEAHVDEQLKNGTYSKEANLAVLKLYLLFPDQSKVEVIESILLKALMAFPAADFSLCMYQIPDKYHATLKEPIRLAQQLEMAKFKAFWKEAEGVEVLGNATGWQDAARHFIAGVISATYRSVRRENLAELLNLPAAEVDGMMPLRGWQKSAEDQEFIIVNTASFESTRVPVKQESTKMTLEQYRNLFMAASG